MEKRKVEAQCGEYKKCLVTEHYTTDGAFSIRPSGGMKMGAFAWRTRASREPLGVERIHLT